MLYLDWFRHTDFLSAIAIILFVLLYKQLRYYLRARKKKQVFITICIWLSLLIAILYMFFSWRLSLSPQIALRDVAFVSTLVCYLAVNLLLHWFCGSNKPLSQKIVVPLTLVSVVLALMAIALLLV